MFDPGDVKYHNMSRPETSLSDVTVLANSFSRPETRFSEITIDSRVQEVDPKDVKIHNGDTEFEFGSDLEDILVVKPSDNQVHETKHPGSGQKVWPLTLSLFQNIFFMIKISDIFYKKRH